MYVKKYDVFEFWESWFNEKLGGREILKTGKSSKYRAFINTFTELKEYVINQSRNRQGSYMSVQPFKERDKPVYIEKLFFDFDDKEDPKRAVREALKVAKLIKKFYGAKPLMFYSGHKGAHLYIYLKEPVLITDLQLYDKVYKELINKILLGLNIETKDSNVFEIKRLARVPYSIHEETGNICLYIDENGNKKYHIPDLDKYRENGLDPDFINLALEKVKNENKQTIKATTQVTIKIKKGVRPVVQKLIEEAKHRDLEHYERLIILFELINNGYSDEEILKVFENQSDFDPKKTLYFIQHARSRDYKPFKTETILKLCPYLASGDNYG